MTEKKGKKSLKIISNILFAIFMLVMTFLIFITAQSRFTGMEPSLFGKRLYVVDSASMEPVLRMNSLIVVREITPDQIQMGDILTYYGAESKTRITHRVVEIGPNNEYFITQGDANNVEDALPVESEKVIGIVALSIPYVGFAFRFLSSTPGIIFILSAGIIALIAPALIKREPKEA